MFHAGPVGSKHGTFKSKNQNFTNLKFPQSEALIGPNKGFQKRKYQSGEK